MIQEGFIIVIGLLVASGIMTYLNMKKYEKQLNKKTIYHVDKSKGYDYDNPKRYFTEPLMRYIFTPMIGSMLMVLPFAIIAGIMNDGGKYLLDNFFFMEYILLAWLFSMIPLAIIYTVLYYARGWDNKDKWKMEYA